MFDGIIVVVCYTLTAIIFSALCRWIEEESEIHVTRLQNAEDKTIGGQNSYIS